MPWKSDWQVSPTVAWLLNESIRLCVTLEFSDQAAE